MPIWADEGRCVVSLEQMPYRGGDFTPIQISEGGRALLAGKLTQLSESQLRAMFESARFPDPATGEATGDVTAWVRTFQDKVRQIAQRPPLPVTCQLTAAARRCFVRQPLDVPGVDRLSRAADRLKVQIVRRKSSV